MHSGVCSVSFRELSVREIISLAKENNIKYIEWGADIHIKPKKYKLAKKVRRLMNGAGIKCESYGSYYGTVYHKGEKKPCPFKYILKTAKCLGAKSVRIWPGFPSCGLPNEKEYEKTVILTRQLCNEAKKYGIALSLEYHPMTVTERCDSTLKLLRDVNCDNLFVNWQTNQNRSFEENVKELKELLPYILNVHVFNWDKDNNKYPLSDASDKWNEYIGILKNKNRLFSLEFMPDNDNKEKSLETEAKTLNSLLGC